MYIYNIKNVTVRSKLSVQKFVMLTLYKHSFKHSNQVSFKPLSGKISVQSAAAQSRFTRALCIALIAFQKHTRFYERY